MLIGIAKICTDRETGKPRGFGFISFEEERDATDAVTGLNETVFSCFRFFKNYIFLLRDVFLQYGKILKRVCYALLLLLICNIGQGIHSPIYVLLCKYFQYKFILLLK